MPVVARTSRFASLLFLSLVTPAFAGWGTDGGAVVTVTRDQTQPLAVADASGGVFLSWVDGRTGFNTDVYATRWNALGATVSGWSATGDGLTLITCAKYNPVGIPDGSGGALYAWEDDRCVGYRQVYARRIAASGVSAGAWPSNGVRLAATTTQQLTPSIASDGAGGAFVAWVDLRANSSGDVYLQRIDATGAISSGWPATGLAVATGSGAHTAPMLAVGSGGDVFVAWQDRRSGSNDDVYAQRVLANGTIASGWTANGTLVCGAAGDQSSPAISADGSGGVYIAWSDRRSGGADLYGIRLQSDATPAPGWSTLHGIALCTASGDQTSPRVSVDATQELSVAWTDRRAGNADLYALRFAAAGGVASSWTEGGVIVCAASGEQTEARIASDGASGLYLTWTDRRGTNADIYASRLANDGSRPAGWDANGNLLCGASGDQTTPAIAAAQGGGAYVVWADARNSLTTGSDVYAQRLLANGPQQVRPSGLSAVHRQGQTFLTFDSPPTTGWTHRVYRSASPITVDADLDAATLVGSIGDSSATDARLSSVLKVLYTFRTDSASAPLPADKGLFVVTPPQSRNSWYAVTSQLAGSPEDRRVVVGANALAVPVSELLDLPRPVWQRTMTVNGITADVYTLWTSAQDTPLFPAMTNRTSSAYDCSVTRGTPGGQAWLRAHAFGGAFIQNLQASGNPAEWVLSVDDHTRNNDVGTFWFGHHPGYNPDSNSNTPPTSGTVVDYTYRRVVHTVEWFRRSFDCDTTRVYAFGYSLGGTFSMQLAFTHPGLIAAAMASTGKVDYGFQSDYNPACAYNPGGQYRLSTSRLWGTPATNLAWAGGMPVYARLDDDSLAARHEARGASFIVNFSGRHDESVGWTEKLGFYAAKEQRRHGGIEFWDNRDHAAIQYAAGFAPMLDLRYLYRFRSDLSWPAFSNCSANGDPGTGDAVSGDSLGTLNGAMDWDAAVSDSVASWRVTLRTRALTTRWGTIAAPESVTVDVTPRRLQRFLLAPGATVQWNARRSSDGAVVQSGSTTVDAMGLVTIPGVRTYRTGTLLSLEVSGVLDAPRPQQGSGSLRFRRLTNPVRDRLLWSIDLPAAGHLRLELLDISGRRVKLLREGAATAGEWSGESPVADLPPGVYLLRLRLDGKGVSSHLVIL